MSNLIWILYIGGVVGFLILAGIAMSVLFGWYEFKSLKYLNVL
jgi:hypothetical protein